MNGPPRTTYVEKREDYATAGIAEYWIVDPMAERILVLALDAERGIYEEASNARRGEVSRSALLPGLVIAVGEALDAD